MSSNTLRALIGKPWLAFYHDVAMTGLAFWLAMYLRLGNALVQDGQDQYGPAMVFGSVLLMAIGAVNYRLFGLYRGIWRYASTEDLMQLAQAVTGVTLCFVLCMFLVNRLDAVPRSVPLIQWFVLLILLGGPRFLYRIVRDRRLSITQLRTSPAVTRIPILLVGTGPEVELLLRRLANDPTAPYRAVGVLDDKARRVGRSLHGVPVLGTTEEIESVLNDLHRQKIRPQRLVIGGAPGALDGQHVRRLLEDCERFGLTLGRIPGVTEFKEAGGEGRLELKPVAIQDLLGRPQAALDLGAIRKLIGGRVVLITGAGGTIGGELTRQIAALEPGRLIMLEQSEGSLYSIDLEIGERSPMVERVRSLVDVRDRDHVMRVFERERPQVVFHAAALKHVPMVEEHPAEGALSNAIGTRNIADASRRCGVHAMVLISTDKAIRPTSVMGATKRVAEAYVQALDLRAAAEGAAIRFMTVRFGNVLGSSGSVVPLFQRQLARGGPLTVTDPQMRRYFMTVEEAVQLVLQASAHGIENRSQLGKVFVLDMGEPVRILDLARQMIRLAGFTPEVDVKITFTGLRPGEKLFEELLDAEESPMPTGDDRVLIVAPRVIDYGLINRACQDLESAARAADTERVLAILGNVVPGFSHARPPLPSTTIA